MILVIGPAADAVLIYFLKFLRQNGSPFLYLDQKEILKQWIFKGDTQNGWSLFVHHKKYLLSDFSGVYVRLADVDRCHAISFHNVQRWLHHFLDIVPLPVVNRPSSSSSNFSKPYQLRLIENFLPVPPSLISNDAMQIDAFRQIYGECIFKSVSSERSIVQPLDQFWESRKAFLKASPILVQPKFPGPNVRVHVVGDRIFSLLIKSGSLDYRYAKRFRKKYFTQSVRLSGDLQKRCTTLTKALGLTFAGIDLIYNGPKEVYCLEVNTSPAYIYFENGDQEISRALSAYLLNNADFNQNQKLAAGQ